MLTKIEILGLRGFSSKHALNLARPTGTEGSGLTIDVGANNAGKSTVIEALRAIAQSAPPSFTQGRRNQAAGDLINIKLTDDQGYLVELASVRAGSSESEFKIPSGNVDRQALLVLPSRRIFDPYFHARHEFTRQAYMYNMGFPSQRFTKVDAFAFRLFSLEKKQTEFNHLLGKVLNPVPDWSIDQMDSGQYFLKIRKPNAYHSSEGMGEGFVSLLYIIDALYDSKEGDCIAIDEPELSLHPALQRKMAKLLLFYSATRQIVLATHSPYFTSIDALGAGATIARVHLKNEGSVISQLTKDTAARLSGLIRNHNNPHILGLDAREVFFLEDQVILLEGQEDVVFFPRIAEQLCPDLPGTAYGWGVGGADNMDVIAQLLSELGFSKVAGVLDANRPEVAARLQKKFPNYNFFLIPANDIRTKRAQPAKDAIQGLLDETNSRIRPEFIEEATRVLNQNQSLSDHEQR